jgi:hypothetical protein
MDSKQDCRDCQGCRVNLKYWTLWCREGKWIYDSGREKRIRLNGSEVLDGDLKIKRRKIFASAQRCNKFEEMD